jgi:hypothetical protein
MTDWDDDEYEVGYKRPPKSNQFKKGKSGNPKGRPKGRKNLKTDLEEELKERITIRENGMPRSISKQRAMVKAITAKAVRGDGKAFATILASLQRYEAETAETSEDIAVLEEDLELLRNFSKRQDGGGRSDDK